MLTERLHAHNGANSSSLKRNDGPSALHTARINDLGAEPDIVTLLSNYEFQPPYP